MNSTLLLIVLTYAFITALLVLIIIHSKLSLLLKLPLVILTGLFMVASYQGWKDAQGWPSGSEIPNKFLLHASVIEEPDSTEGTDGQIFIWMTDLEAQQPAAEPRAYVLNYDQDVHSALEDALRNMRKGNIQIGSKRVTNSSNLPPRDFSRLGEQRITLEFSDLPDPALPEK